MPVDPITDPADEPVEMDRHEERLDVSVTRVPYRNVRIHRRIVTEIRHIDVELRSEVLDIDWEPAYPSAPGDPASGVVAPGSEAWGSEASGGVAAAPERLEVILSGEEPQIQLVTVAKERVVINRVSVPGTVDVTAELRSERIAVESGPPSSEALTA